MVKEWSKVEITVIYVVIQWNENASAEANPRKEPTFQLLMTIDLRGRYFPMSKDVTIFYSDSTVGLIMNDETASWENKQVTKYVMKRTC